MNKKNIIVFEHGTLKQCDVQCENCEYRQADNCISHCRPEYYNELKKYAEYNPVCGFSCVADAIEFKEYTGLLQLSDGAYMEILPKVTHTEQKLEEEYIENGRKIFENLIFASHNLLKEYKWNAETNAQPYKSRTILEIYICLFCYDLSGILQKGIKKSYARTEANLPVYKGKIKFQKHIACNSANAARFYVEYNQFSIDIPENRILKAACLCLLKQTKDQNSKKTLLKFLMELDSASPCVNLEKDLQSAAPNRLYPYYERPLRFAEFFLRNEIFYPQKGRKKILSLLFPLDEMFEDYLEYFLRKYQREQKQEIKLFSQYAGNYLAADENKKSIFNTKMDFVILDEKLKKICILDAKWKKLNVQKENNAVLQADLYQLFAYAGIMKNAFPEYEVSTALIYPQTPMFPVRVDWSYFNAVPLSLIPVNPSLDLSVPREKHIFLDEFLKNMLCYSIQLIL